jgi:hypothetical protein
MTTDQALFSSVFGKSLVGAEQVAARAAGEVRGAIETLRDDGSVLLPGVLGREEVEHVRAGLLPLLGPVGRNQFEGERTQRVYGLLKKTRAIDPLVEHPQVLSLVDAFLDCAQLSAALVVNLLPGEVSQPWHCDGEYFGVPRPRAPIGVSTVWALDDFTDDNGATEVAPGSHRWGDRRPDEQTPTRHAVMPAGSVLVFFDHFFHRAGANRSAAPRLGLTIQYCQGWARGIENMGLLLPAETVADLSPRMQDLVGYGIHHAFVGYVDGRHPKKLLPPRGR